MVIAVVVVDRISGDILNGPDITSRGFVFEEVKAHILDDAQSILREVLEEAADLSAPIDWDQVRKEIHRKLRRFFNKVLERRPIILPIIVEL
jgi:ribonuclease J